jgi:hypothetical protein
MTLEVAARTVIWLFITQIFPAHFGRIRGSAGDARTRRGSPDGDLVAVPSKSVVLERRACGDVRLADPMLGRRSDGSEVLLSMPLGPVLVDLVPYGCVRRSAWT